MSFVVAENLLKQMGQEWTTAEIKDVAAFDCASYLYNLTSDESVAESLPRTRQDRQDQGMLFSMLRIILAGDVYGAIGSHYS